MIDTSQKILKLKVAVSQVTNFPFDVVYIVDQSLKSLIPRMFLYSLCLPFNDDLTNRLCRVSLDEIGTIGGTGKLPGDTPIRGCSPMHLFVSEETLRRSFLVVPVLPRTHERTRSKRRKDRNPAYLVANRHRAGEHTTRNGAVRSIGRSAADVSFFAFFNDEAVMFTPRGPQRPVCLLCPRHLEHVQGKCMLGEQKCYESLILSPQREEASREQLQTD